MVMKASKKQTFFYDQGHAYWLSIVDFIREEKYIKTQWARNETSFETKKLHNRSDLIGS